MKIVEEIKSIIRYARESHAYDEMMWSSGYGEIIYDEDDQPIGEENPDKPRHLIFYIIGALPLSITPLICKWKGHDIVDRGYGGPDSGCMDHECRRCGQYWSVPLY
jgi:hypothetical protein